MQKTSSKRQLIFEKWWHFKNGQKWPQCKGYSPCKILSLDQKIKLPQTCEKRFYKHTRVALCEKRLEKNVSTNLWEFFYAKMARKKKLIFKKVEQFENGKKWPQKIKFPKTCEKRFYKHIRVVLCKKRLEKTANIWKMRGFWKWPKMAKMQRL